MRDFGDPIPKIFRILSDKHCRCALLYLYDGNKTLDKLVGEMKLDKPIVENALDSLECIGFASHKIAIDFNTQSLFSYYELTSLGRSFVDNLLKTFEEEFKVDNIPD